MKTQWKIKHCLGTIETIFMALYRPLIGEPSIRLWITDEQNNDSLAVGSFIAGTFRRQIDSPVLTGN